ncbi:hypothetical protein DWB78_16445 [Halopelagius longus]|uniref:Uncharacterized protein n=1 Tax=Halopelagius longus TaxID=1236180 RepID=A0A370IHP7_9EURY|nr:hypothetical protein DWB78_16445 [Halopelagius longus]
MPVDLDELVVCGSLFRLRSETSSASERGSVRAFLGRRLALELFGVEPRDDESTAVEEWANSTAPLMASTLS